MGPTTSTKLETLNVVYTPIEEKFQVTWNIWIGIPAIVKTFLKSHWRLHGAQEEIILDVAQSFMVLNKNFQFKHMDAIRMLEMTLCR
jgi:hypothetical protein